MGHSDIRLTLDTYGGLFGDDLDALAASMDEAATQRVPDTNRSKMVPLAVSVDALETHQQSRNPPISPGDHGGAASGI